MLALEPLACWIRQTEDIKGIVVAGIPSKISLFVDDILLTLPFPHVTLSTLMHTLQNFAAYSGLHVNPFKPCAMNVSLPN